jgi:hypothetical protein
MKTEKTLAQRLLQYAVLAVFLVFAFWFLAGPHGLFSINSRQRRERTTRADISRLEQKLKEREDRREWLKDEDSASVLARKLLGDKPDSTASPR